MAPELFDGIHRTAIWHRWLAITGLVLLVPHILLASNQVEAITRVECQRTRSGCDIIWGYWFSRSLPPDQALDWLAAARSSGSPSAPAPSEA